MSIGDPAEWPELSELAQVLDVTSQDWDLTLSRVLAAAIGKVKKDVGNWDEDVDEPNVSLAQAALRMGELISLRPEAAAETTRDPTYNRLLKGERRVFGIG